MKILMVAGLFNSFADCSVLKCLQRQKDTYLTLRKTERQLSGVLGSKSNTISEDGEKDWTGLDSPSAEQFSGPRTSPPPG